MTDPTNPIYRSLPAWSFERRSKRFLEIEARCTKTESGCWLLATQGGSNGYGTITLTQDGKRQQWPAHRYMWALVNGEIPKRLYVCHRCDVRLCVCPEHLFLGTHADNMADAMRKGRHGCFHWRRRPRRPKPPKIKRGRVVLEGLTLRELAEKYCIPLIRIRARYQICGMRGPELIAPKMKPGRWRQRQGAA